MPKHYDALVSYPGFGSMWLDNVRLADGYVTGRDLVTVGDHEEWMTFNFPVSCVRKVVSRG